MSIPRESVMRRGPLPSAFASQTSVLSFWEAENSRREPSGEYVKVAHDQQEVLAPMGVPDPTIGLYSATNASKGATLNQAITDKLNDIISGRAPLSAYDQMVQDWRANGGDLIRKELQDAVQKAHS